MLLREPTIFRIESSELVDKFYVESIGSNPHTSLCYFLYTLHRQSSSIGYTLAEQGISTVYISLKHSSLFGIEWARHEISKCRVAVGFHFIEFHSELLCDESTQVGST